MSDESPAAIPVVDDIPAEYIIPQAPPPPAPPVPKKKGGKPGVRPAMAAPKPPAPAAAENGAAQAAAEEANGAAPASAASSSSASASIVPVDAASAAAGNTAPETAVVEAWEDSEIDYSAPRVKAVRRPSVTILAAAENAAAVPAPRIVAEGQQPMIVAVTNPEGEQASTDENGNAIAAAAGAGAGASAPSINTESPNPAAEGEEQQETAPGGLGLFSPTRPAETPMAPSSELNIFSPTRPVQTPAANAAPVPAASSAATAAPAAAAAASSSASSSSSSSSSAPRVGAGVAAKSSTSSQPYSRRASLLSKSHLNFKSCLKHQFPLIDTQVTSGQNLVKRITAFLKRVCELTELHNQGLLKLTQGEESKWEASRVADAMSDHVKAANQVSATIEALATRDLAFAQKMMAGVVKPLLSWIPLAEERRAKLVKDEKAASSNMFLKNSDAEKIRLACVKYWSELGGLRKDREKASKDSDSKSLEKLSKKILKTKADARKEFIRFESLKESTIARTNEYRNVIMPHILNSMEELEKDRMEILKKILGVYANIVRETTGDSPSLSIQNMLNLFENQIGLLSSSIDMNRCIEAWITAHGMPPVDPPVIVDLPCSSEQLAPESNAWEMAITAAASMAATTPASPSGESKPAHLRQQSTAVGSSEGGPDRALASLPEDGSAPVPKGEEEEEEDDEDETLASATPQAISEAWVIAQVEHPHPALAAVAAAASSPKAADSVAAAAAASSVPSPAEMPLLRFQVDDIIRVTDRTAAASGAEGWWVGSVVSDIEGKIGRFPKALVRSVDDKPPADAPPAAGADAAAGPSLADIVRAKVSKKKKRFQQDGFDLDLTYVLPNIIAMGFPSEGLEGQYRNHMVDVQRFFNKRHESAYKLYNLCSERWYDAAKFDGRVSRYPFDVSANTSIDSAHTIPRCCNSSQDHNPCAFETILPIMKDIDNHLKPNGVLNPQRVAAIHCKAGKGRTGFIICCYLLYSSLFPSYQAELSLRYYAIKRTKNQKGVTIPSQIRYVHYFARWLRLERGLFKFPSLPKRNPVLLQTIRLIGIPRSTTNKDVWFKLVQGDGKYSSKGKASLERRLGEDYLMIQGSGGSGGGGAQITGITSLDHDCHITFYTGGIFETTKLFQFWFNTRFIGVMETKENNEKDQQESNNEEQPRTLVLTKAELDKACKDVQHKNYVDTFRVELLFASA